MQNRFYGRVGALYGLSRGEKRIEGEPARRHKSVAEYKAESRRVQAELDELSREMDELSLSDEVGDMRGASRKLDVHEAPARPRDNQVL